jgi:surface antigen Omp85-like protein
MGANLIIAAVTVLLQSSPANTTTKPSPTLQHSDTVTAEPTSGLAFERLSDLLQYNRVQGLSLGLGYRLSVPGVGFTAGYGTIRYGFSDERVTGRLSLVRDSPEDRLAISGYHDISDLDPFSPGRSLTNTFNSLFAGHDNGDYALSDGGAATVEVSIATSLELSLSARVERQRSTARVARSAINDFLGGNGLFPPNPLIKEGVFGSLVARLSGVRHARWSLALDVMGGAGQTTARMYGDVRRSFGWRREITVRIRAGAGTEPTLPQTLFRLGGLNTVRGFEYGTVRSPAFWAAQLDLAPVGGRVRPVLFVDAGQGGRIGDLFSGTALVGGGVGVSLFRGLVRLDFSRPISPDVASKVRFDLVFQGVR